MIRTRSNEGYAPFFVTATHYTTHCNTLQYTATHYTIHCNTLHCNTLQYTATHYNTLQHTTIHCNTLHNTLQHTTIHCNTLRVWSLSNDIGLFWLFLSFVGLFWMMWVSFDLYRPLFDITGTILRDVGDTPLFCRSLLISSEWYWSLLTQTGLFWHNMYHTQT